MTEIADPEREAFKRQAQDEFEMLMATRNRSIDAVISMAKWLLASLLAVNGAGALAVLNGADKLASPALPGCLFVSGVVLALVNGAAQQYVGLQQSNKLSPVIGYWIWVWASGERDAETEAEQRQLGVKMMRVAHLSALPGWASAICFLGGSVALGMGLK